MDSILWIASCTKLLTAISVLQLVEKGLLTLDEDVSKYVPEVKSLEILTGFDKDTGKATTEPNPRAITVRSVISLKNSISLHCPAEEMLNVLTGNF